MKILFCNFEYPPLGGGGGISNALLAEELAQRHKVTVLTSQYMDMPYREYKNGVEIIRVPVPFRTQLAVANPLSMVGYMRAGIRVGKKLLAISKYDVINTHFVLPTGPVGDALARFSGTPNVLSLHGGDLYDPSKLTSPHRHPILRWWVRRMLKKAAVVVGQSTNTIENMHRFYNSEIRALKIPLGIRRPILEPVSRKKYGFDDKDILLVTVGRLVSRKAIEQLIAMMGTFERKRVCLLIIGAGPKEAFLRHEAEKYGVSDCVRFMGYVEEAEKFNIINMCDIFVSTTQHEGFGLMFIEAMACGLPVVCYDRGGHRDFLINDVTGFVVPVNAREEFKNGIQRLVVDSALRKRMGAENLRRVEEYFIDRCAQRYEAAFEEALWNSMNRFHHPVPIMA
ncbi:MAG: glycosyltransferase family 4 protein [Nitrospirae bacterium]|nr:glycosyltransferase family 4 protein [Nitrospirota bacterium]